MKKRIKISLAILVMTTIIWMLPINISAKTIDWNGSYADLIDKLTQDYMTCNENDEIVVNDKFYIDNNIEEHILNDILSNHINSEYNLKNRRCAMKVCVSKQTVYLPSGKSELEHVISLKNADYSGINEKQYNSLLDNIVSELSLQGKSDIEKIYLLHQYIIKNYEYNNKTERAVKYMNTNTGIACGQYASIYRDLLNKVGINSIIIDGTSLNKEAHCWNLVEYNNKWYFTDVTWDDEPETLDYFMVGLDKIKKDHVIGECFKKSLEKYNISNSDLQYSKVPYIIKTSVTDDRYVSILCDMGDASNVTLKYNNKNYKNGSKIKIKDNKKLVVQFANEYKTKYKFIVKKFNAGKQTKYVLLAY